MYKQPRTIVFLGPPGSGKGTQAARLSAVLEIPAVSTGEILRRECQAGTELGKSVGALLQAGKLVPDQQMNRVVENRLRQKDCRGGCILDGFPRSVDQALFLDKSLTRLGTGRPTVFNFVVSADELIERLALRRQCPTCGRIYKADTAVSSGSLLCQNDRSPLVTRSDDRPEAIRERLNAHTRNCADLVRYYENREYFEIAAGRCESDVTGALLQALGLQGVLPIAVSGFDRLAMAAC